MAHDRTQTGGRSVTAFSFSQEHEVCDEAERYGAVSCKLNAGPKAVAHEAATTKARLNGTKA